MYELQEFNPIKKKWVKIGRATSNLEHAEIYLESVRKTYADLEKYKDYKTQTRIYNKQNNTVVLV